MGGAASIHGGVDLKHKHGGQHRFPEFGDILDKIESKLYTFEVDRSTQFWIQLCKLQITNVKPDSSVVKVIEPKKILSLHPGAVEGFDTAIRFTDLDEDYGDIDESLSGMVQGAMFLHAQNLKNDESDLEYFPSVERGIEAGRDVLGKALPQSIVPWHDLSSDDAMSKLAFCGLGQMYLTAVRHPKAINVLGAVYEIDLTFLFEYATRAAFERYGCVAIFGADKNIIAIYWCLAGKVVYAPDAGTEDQAVLDEWSHVKFVFKSSLITAVTLKDHLVHLHWTISNNLMFASRQSFSANHPLRRLLKPHTYRAASINWASKTVLLPDDALAWRVFALDKSDWYRAVNDCIHANKYQTFDAFCKEKDLPEEVAETLPLIQDGKALTAVIRKYVSHYVSVYYKDDAAVLADKDIATYWAHYGSLPMWPSYNLPALSKETLIDQMTHSIFGVTGLHEFQGSIVEYLDSPAGLGCKIAPGKAEVDVQSFFQQLSLIALTGLRQPALINEWKHIILHDDMSAHHRAEISGIVDAFQTDLKALAAEVDARNANQELRQKPFMAMNPSVLECSVSI